MHTRLISARLWLVAIASALTLLVLPGMAFARVNSGGGFYQQTGGNWIFKVNENGSLAYKVDIQLGNQNTDYYEVLSGLQAGDKVVTSS